MTGKEIRDALKEKGITQKELAEDAKVAVSTMNLFLHRRFKSARLSAIVNNVLGVKGAI